MAQEQKPNKEERPEIVPVTEQDDTVIITSLQQTLLEKVEDRNPAENVLEKAKLEHQRSSSILSKKDELSMLIQGGSGDKIPTSRLKRTYPKQKSDIDLPLSITLPEEPTEVRRTRKIGKPVPERAEPKSGIVMFAPSLVNPDGKPKVRKENNIAKKLYKTIIGSRNFYKAVCDNGNKIWLTVHNDKWKRSEWLLIALIAIMLLLMICLITGKMSGWNPFTSSWWLYLVR